MIDTTVPGSPGWWLHRLSKDLEERRPRLQRLADRYEGNGPLPAGPDNCAAAFRQFQKRARANWAELIVEAPRERMEVVGFRTGADGDENGDAEAWRIWTANGLDADASLLFRAQLSMGDAYAIVGGVDPSIGAPLITVEDPREVVTAHDPHNRRRTVAALKQFVDEWTGEHHALLYLPGEVYRARMPRSDYYGSQWDINSVQWMSDGPDRLPTNVVPVVRFANRPNLQGRTFGEFESVEDDLDRIDTMLLQRMVIAVMQAFRQRAAKGLEKTDKNGNDIDWSGVFRADPGAIWAIPGDVDLWESSGADLTPILESVKADVRDVAATTRTPMFYLFPDAANGSAEGASLQREGLIFKTNDRIRHSSAATSQIMSLAFTFSGDSDRADMPQLKTLWAPPERFSLSERYDAASKAAAAGVPWRTRMESILQFSPEEIGRMDSERASDLLLDPLAEGMEQTNTAPATDVEAEDGKNVAEAVQKLYLGVGKVLTTAEVRGILNQKFGLNLDTALDVSSSADADL